ncbi:MAG TPA: Imm50 family immunity protein [Verrucomicrobiae bacterium]
MTVPTNIFTTPIAPDTLASISGRELLTQHLGHWPTFHDFEVLSITVERPLVITATKDLRATFLIFDLTKSPDSPERKQGTVEILFEDIDDLKIEGFNHQNPILGLSITHSPDEPSRLAVKWAGPAWKNDASFTCSHISILRVIDLNPFQKTLPYG